MVLPPSAADPGAAQAPGWLDRLIRPLELTREGILLCLRDATPTQLGPVVRALSPSPPWAESGEVLEVCLRATDVLDVAPGSRVLLRVRVEDLDWLNVARPLFAERKLRTVLWADAAAHEGLVRRAVDFYDWVSRTVPVPAKPVPDFAVERMRAAMNVGAEIVWRGGQLREVLDAAGISTTLALHVDEPYLSLIESLRGETLPIVAGVREERDAWRVRLASAEADHAGTWIAIEPRVQITGMRELHSQQEDWDEAADRLRSAGWRRPALTSAWLDLQPERIDDALRHVNKALDVNLVTSVTQAMLPDSDAARLVVTVRELDGLPSMDVIQQAENAGFPETAASMTLARWKHGEDVDAGQLIEWLFDDGAVELASEVLQVWQARDLGTGAEVPASQIVHWQNTLRSATTDVETTLYDASDDADREYLERWVAGDRAAGNILVKRHYLQLHRYFATKVEAEAATDLVQETFARLTAAANRYSGHSSFRSYLFRIANHILHEELRRRLRPNGEFDPLVESIAEIGTTPYSTLLQNEEIQLLFGALRSLPVSQQDLLELSYFQRLKRSQIAEVLGIPVNTVASRVARARRQLAARYAALTGQSSPSPVEPGALEAQFESARAHLNLTPGP